MGWNRPAQPNLPVRSWAGGPSAKTGELGSYDGWVVTQADSRWRGAGRGTIARPARSETVWGSGEGRDSLETALDGDAGQRSGTGDGRPDRRWRGPVVMLARWGVLVAGGAGRRWGTCGRGRWIAESLRGAQVVYSPHGRGHLLGSIAERTRTATTSGLTRRVLSHHCKGIVAATLHLGCYNPPPLKKSHPEITKEERSLGKTKNGHWTTSLVSVARR
jgi:hypothetical protein